LFDHNLSHFQKSVKYNSKKSELLPIQKKDFEEIFETMQGKPVTIRFLDPPLHEFNPMMGFRGCRLSVSFPEIAQMQTQTVIEVAINIQKKHPSWKIVPEILIPLVGEAKEFSFVKSIVKDVANEIIQASGITLHYLIGTMIEIPRACVTADKIAAETEFFSFGTNDLTHMGFGFSRDDAGKFLMLITTTKYMRLIHLQASIRKASEHYWKLPYI
jgi:pyruvate,orthophosphate dikinase